MGDERIRYIRSLQTLVPLHEHTDAIGLADDGRIQVMTRLESPADEYGIPRPDIMVHRLLGVMATQNYVWPGQFDEHHLATPKADFSIIRTNGEGDIGSAFRGLSCLKIELPRQMHNFAHALFELPGRPSVDIMRQAVFEIGQVKQLQTILNEHSPGARHAETQQMRTLCIDAIARALESMQEPEVGMAPSLEELAKMELEDVRSCVGSMLKVRRFSKKHLIHPAIRKAQQKQARTAA